MVIASIVFLVAAVSMPILIRACANGKIRVNPIAGIRIRNVMASEAAWRAGHEAAVGPCRVGAGIGVILSLVSLLPGISEATQSTLVLVAALALVAAVAIGAFLANRAALDQLASDAPMHSEAG